nr:hypothetical protein GCM10020093_053200 [Planobispora longispora]
MFVAGHLTLVLVYALLAGAGPYWPVPVLLGVFYAATDGVLMAAAGRSSPPSCARAGWRCCRPARPSPAWSPPSCTAPRGRSPGTCPGWWRWAPESWSPWPSGGRRHDEKGDTMRKGLLTLAATLLLAGGATGYAVWSGGPAPR